MEALRCETSPREASKAAKELVGLWPHARPPDTDTYAAGIAAVLAGYPRGVVQECCDPRTGLARSREFPPTPAAVVEWCDRRVVHHQRWAAYVPVTKTPEYDGREFSPEHRKTMLERLQGIMEPFRRKPQREAAGS
jgi:hypothetical protein